MSESPLETEAAAGTATFRYFDREWTVPTVQHHEHIRKTKAIVRRERNLDADDVASIYLPPEQYAALCDLNVLSSDLDDFATEIAKHLGMGDSGNSSPSSASS